jgi:peptidoglycan/xylan/chitin deacetylase (PgdA/CDA1 family)
MKKLKAITLSYDDGVEQDKRLIEILDRYSLKSTFNINSGMFNKRTCHQAMLFNKMTTFNNHRIPVDEIKQVYANHEVAAHSATHPILTQLPDEQVIFQMESDAKTLEEVTGKKVMGFAYPGAACEYFNERVKGLIMNNTDLHYGRTAKSCYSFDIPCDLMMFDPTVSHRELEMREKLAKKFIELEADKPQIFYIWGHSYELDVDESIWEGFERFCELIAGHDDIFYGTNDEVFRYFNLYGNGEEK